MEILSTGEKIKRARVYQGITLKELCSDEISISKMSCIENGKIKADSEILHYISKKLDIDYNYLVQDVYEQIEENLNLLRKNEVPLDKIDEFINYSLEYAMDYSYLDLAFELIHRLFNFYVENNKIENIQLLISQYYDLYQKSSNDENTLIYYNDMASFFMKTKEYNEAINYFSKMREIIEENGIKDKKSYVYICFREGLCYKETNEIQESYNKIISAVKYIDYIEDPKDKGKIYQEFATLNNILVTLSEEDNDDKLIPEFQSIQYIEQVNLELMNVNLDIWSVITWFDIKVIEKELIDSKKNLFKLSIGTTTDKGMYKVVKHFKTKEEAIAYRENISNEIENLTSSEVIQ